MKIIYLHGFASVGTSAKSDALRACFGPENVLAPDLPADPREVRTLVDTLVRANARHGLALVGTSLGGFYAWHMSQRWDVPCVLVNPSTRPSTTLGCRVGTHKNHVTGEDVLISPGFAAVWADMESDARKEQNGALISLFLAQDDEVLAPAVAAADIPFSAHRSVLPDGGHRFERHWPLVVQELQRIADEG